MKSAGAVIRESRNGPGLRWSPSACFVRAYAVDPSSASSAQDPETNSQMKARVSINRGLGAPSVADARQFKNARCAGVTSQNVKSTGDVEDAARSPLIDPAAGSADVSGRQCRRTFDRLPGAAELAGKSHHGFCLDRLCVLCVLRSAVPAPSAWHRPAAWRFELPETTKAHTSSVLYWWPGNRYQTEIASRPNRHLAYSHGKFCRGHPTTYDKGQV
jgi:hypothetical protein